MSNELFNLKESEVASSFTKKTAKGADGLLRPKLEEGKDGKRELVVRFLPNFTRDRKLGPSIYEKHIHYADFKENPKIKGYYDCQQTNGVSCDLCNTFWALWNDEEKRGMKRDDPNRKSKSINRSGKYYAYVYVVEDKYVPANEGKIFIYPFGYQIYELIMSARERSKKSFYAEDLLTGADMVIEIKKNQYGLQDYSTSYFDDPAPIDIGGIDIKLTKSGMPTAETEEAIIDFLLSREHDIEDFFVKEWTDQQQDNVNEIIALLTNQSYTPSTSSNEKVREQLSANAVFAKDSIEDDYDDTYEEEEEEVIKPAKRKKAVVVEEEEEEEEIVVKPAKRKKAVVVEDDEEDDAVNTKASVSRFFDDDDDDE